MNQCEECDRKRVCEILGQCFLTHDLISSLPGLFKKQIKGARSVKQALIIFKQKKYVRKVSKEGV